MNDIKRVPDVRFDKFFDEWEEVLLKDVVQRVTRKNKNIESDIPLTISSEYGLIDQREYFGKQVASNNMSNYYLINKGEFAYNKSYSNGYPMGTIKRLDKYDNGALSPLYIVFKPNTEDIDSDYFVSYFDQSSWHREINKIATEGARNHGILNISVNDFFKIKLLVPKSKEQQQIGKLFKTVDALIQASETQVANIEQYKKAMLQKMFPRKEELLPEIRFKGFDDKWNKTKLGDIIIKNSQKNVDDLDMQIESVSNKNGFISQEQQFENRRVASTSLANYTIIKPKTFAYNPSRINVGSIAYKAEGRSTGVVSPLYVSFYTTDDLDDLFLVNWLDTDTFENQRQVYTEGSVRETLNYTNFSEMKITLPSVKEQILIGTFFKTLDDQINAEKQQLNNYKTLKQGLLQRLFV